ncbi:MAG: glycosyltransferase [Deltaproteobacteria bacterium]|nr:glycosyltransferase [Deltaproteobacteria bacterium]
MYPLWLKRRPRAGHADPAEPAAWPSLSIVVAAHNEENAIGAKLDDLLSQDYPGTAEIIVASDASEDRTDEIVRSYEDRGVRLVRQEERRGKSLAQNLACEQAAGDILVFTDASVLLGPGALRHLVRGFSDETIGCVTGEDVSGAASSADASAGAGAYTGFEKKLRRLEVERTGTLIGVSGCLFAVRRFLRPEVPAEAVDDLYVPLSVVSRGFRVTVADGAPAYVKRTKDLSQEYRRKIRTFTGGLFTVAALWKTHDRTALDRARAMIWGHKILRWLGPFFLAAQFLASAFLSPRHPLFLLWFVAQVVLFNVGLYGVAVLSRAAGKEGHVPVVRVFGKIVRLTAFFLVTQTALLAAWLRFLTGRPFATWAPTRRAEAGEAL